jgi:leucine-rich PPR motif-containing protein
MVKEMSARGFEPDCFTYGLLLDYLCKKGKCTEARKIFDSMIRKGINTVIDGLLLSFLGSSTCLLWEWSLLSSQFWLPIWS